MFSFFPSPALRKGFTLLELIVYVALASVIVITILQVTLLVLSAKDKTSSQSDVQQYLRLALQRMTTEMLNAQQMTAADNGVLSLTTPTGSTTFYLANGVIYRKESSGTALAITPPNLKVQTLQFSNLSNGTASQTVNITVSITDPAAPPGNTLTVQTSVTLRSCQATNSCT